MATFALVHGAGDVGWYWHLVMSELRPIYRATTIRRLRRPRTPRRKKKPFQGGTRTAPEPRRHRPAAYTTRALGKAGITANTARSSLPSTRHSRDRTPRSSHVNPEVHRLLSRPLAGARAPVLARLRAINRTIVDSPTLFSHEQQVFARFTASLAAAIAEETGTHPSDVTPWVVAIALIGLHRSLIDYVRRENARRNAESQARARRPRAGDPGTRRSCRRTRRLRIKRS